MLRVVSRRTIPASRKSRLKPRHAAALALLSWTMNFTVPGNKSHPDGLVVQRGMMGYPTEAACNAAMRQAEADWRKEGDDVDDLGHDPAHPLPKCVERGAEPKK